MPLPKEKNDAPKGSSRPTGSRWYYATNIDTAMADAYAIGKILYPKRFADVDLVRKADAIYIFLVGQPVTSRMQADFGRLGRPAPFADD